MWQRLLSVKFHEPTEVPRKEFQILSEDVQPWIPPSRCQVWVQLPKQRLRPWPHTLGSQTHPKCYQKLREVE